MSKSKNNKFLIDGYPRELPQAHAFEKHVGECTFSCHTLISFSLSLPFISTVTRSLTHSLTHSHTPTLSKHPLFLSLSILLSLSGTFVLYFDVPDEIMIKRCIARGVSSGRSDDNEISIKNRVKVYHEQSKAAVGIIIFFFTYALIISFPLLVTSFSLLTISFVTYHIFSVTYNIFSVTYNIFCY